MSELLYRIGLDYARPPEKSVFLDWDFSLGMGYPNKRPPLSIRTNLKKSWLHKIS